jgi:hypothetical protein
MSDDLSALLRAAALEQEGAARTERPYSVEMLRRYVRDVRRRRAVAGASLAVAGVAVVGGVILGATHLAPPDPLTPVGTSTAPSASPSPTIESTPTPAPTATTVPPPTPTSPPPTSTAALPTHQATQAPPASPRPEPPGVVTVVYSGPGGGSGEVMVTWAPTAGATGYRVYRSAAATGPFALSASYDVATGRTTVAFADSYESIQIWQPQSLGDNDVQYVEAIRGDRAYFRVTAFNAGGEGPMSGVVCGEAPGLPPSQC